MDKQPGGRENRHNRKWLGLFLDRAAEYWRGRDDFDFILIGKDGSITISEGIEDSFSFSGEQGSVAFEVVRR